MGHMQETIDEMKEEYTDMKAMMQETIDSLQEELDRQGDNNDFPILGGGGEGDSDRALERSNPMKLGDLLYPGEYIMSNSKQFKFTLEFDESGQYPNNRLAHYYVGNGTSNVLLWSSSDTQVKPYISGKDQGMLNSNKVI